MTEPIDYIELPGGDLPATKGFYAGAFGWAFTDYGPEYAAIDDAGLDGGFDATTASGPTPLVILKADDLEGRWPASRRPAARSPRPIFEFPGGRRFHFRDPAGNVLGVWAE